MKKLTKVLSVLTIGTMIALTGCSSSQPASGNQAASNSNNAQSEAKPADSNKVPVKDQLYIEVSALGNLDYFYDHKLGMEAAGKALGVQTEYVGPAEYDMNAMITAFEQAIAKKPQGIVVVGFEDSLNPVVDKAVDAGIPVVTVDGDLPNTKRVAFVGTGNVQAGIKGGEELARLIGEKGKVAIMTKPGQANLEERIQGYKLAIAKYPDIEIVQIVDTQSDTNVAAQGAASLLQKYPDLAGIACVEAAGGSGAATAVKEAGKEGKVKIVAMDRGNDVVQAIKDGVISATVAQQTALMPFYATDILFNMYNNDIAITNDNAKAGVTGAPTMIDTGAVIVNQSNADQFLRTNQ
ncbi:substrate-binding domain-containing protein [Ammoniphilus resinae]|uniref:Ribose transport system substrate-binding protein n=1 Tax=Ammoniphilus resinae TaxID=861532 RepID=A0ABS4GVJ8_9BACL|nr:substrate-binding domain-containing protein [Ammoniphilus resinae]MBP1934303.1 ribose transport system substrate-binding protein [Ammoniphilus resinae]